MCHSERVLLTQLEAHVRLLVELPQVVACGCFAQLAVNGKHLQPLCPLPPLLCPFSPQPKSQTPPTSVKALPPEAMSLPATSIESICAQLAAALLPLLLPLLLLPCNTSLSAHVL